MKKAILLVGALIIVVLGIIVLWPKSSEAPVTSSADYKNTTYTIEGSKVTLKDGTSSTPAAPGSASMVTTKYFGNEAKGDLNGDSIPDLAFLITQNNGGSGTFYYVVAALQNTDGGYTGTNAILLGDRISPQNSEFQNGTIVVNYADRKPGQPMTAELTEGVSKYLQVQNGVLVEIPNPNTVSTTGGKGTLGGTVLLGPTCPVMRNPPDPQCADKPYATTLVLKTPNGTKILQQFDSSKDGTFSVSVPAGEYVISNAAATGVLPRCSSNGTVKITANKTATTTIYCDTGIR